ncbi:DNAase [Vibrio campbellii]|uniref:DNAase n=1 Tax=Vibrio campbellii TaxID=680 RepID=A0ABY5IFR7_9VIBR|nr:DNAase [Vibrio campbellii]UTZ31739.1 DNAase [Vibrio campbellii]
MIEVMTGNERAMSRLEVAFRACPADYQDLQTEVKGGRVSVYRLTGEGYDVIIAGEIVGDSYFLWGLVGAGLVSAIHELSAHVKSAGLSSISAATHHPSMARLCRKLNTLEADDDDRTLMTMEVH